METKLKTTTRRVAEKLFLSRSPYVLRGLQVAPLISKLRKGRINLTTKLADGTQLVKSDSLQKCAQKDFIAITLSKS